MEITPVNCRWIIELNEVEPLLMEDSETNKMVTSILKYYYQGTSNIPNHPAETLRLFKIALCGSCGFKAYSETKKTAEAYLSALQDCFDSYESTSSLVVTALQLHRNALDEFLKPHSNMKEALTSMKRTQEIANKLFRRYEIASMRFSSTDPLLEDLYYTLRTNIETVERDNPLPSRRTALESLTISSLYASLNAISTINQLRVEMSHAHSLNANLCRNIFSRIYFEKEPVEDAELSTLQKAFTLSYVKWLALGKTHYSTRRSLQGSIVRFQEIEALIKRISKTVLPKLTPKSK